MKRMILFLFAVSILSTGIAPVEFDWTRYSLKIATTEKTGAVNLLRKALLATQYDDRQTVAEFLSSRPDRDTKITNFISDYITIQQHFLTDGSIEYVHQLRITNKIMQTLVPEPQPVKWMVPMLCPLCGQEWPESRPVPDSINLIPHQKETSDYTGIVFDCRGYDLKPCLFPEVVTEDGTSVYSAHFASVQSVMEWGLVEYNTAGDLNPPRAGRKPLVIKATGVAGIKQSNIVIPTKDAQRIHGSTGNIKLLQQCRVVIIFG